MISRPIIRALLVLHCALAVCAAHAQGIDPAGRPVVEVIESLRDQGIRIIYSNELLPGRLRVTQAPRASDPIERLREILAPHGLDLDAGPRDTWLVVRAAPPIADAGSDAGALPALRLVPPTLETIVVTASRYAIERPAAVSASTIGRRMLENSPALGQDPLRVTLNLPGVTSNELSSQSHIRGGELDEALFRLDGIRLFSPYHLKDFQTVFSSINPRIVESMDIRTGGYEARFGDRMSGVIDMHSIVPTEARHHEIGLSMLDASVLSSGVFARGRGSWVTSIRRGNLDVLAEAADSDKGQPQYVDFFNKLSYSLNSRWDLTASILSLDDKIGLNDGDEVEAAADYDDSYLWLTLENSAPSGLETTIRLVSTDLQRTRTGRIDDADRATGSLNESGQFDRFDLNADFRLGLTDRQQLSWGFELAELSLDHRFESERTMLLPISVPDLTGPSSPPASAHVELDQTKRAFYLSYRLRILPRVVTELGLRRDNQSVTDEAQTSPRFNLLFDITDRTSLRAAWGRFAQSHSPTDLAISDGSTSLLPAEKSEHLVLGLEHYLGETTTLRVEVYSKRVSQLNRRFENVFERASLIPELLPDRFRVDPLRARVRGVELSIEGGDPDRVTWWANLARAEAEETLASGRFDRSWDERWSLKLGGEWLRDSWTITASAVLRSGWPITTLLLVNDELVSGPFNAERLADFTSVNVRANRRVQTANGEFDWYIEISNLLDRANYCCLDYSYEPAGGGQPATLTSSRDDLLGIVPNIGLRWQF